MLSLSTFVTRLSWLPAARSKAQFTCRAVCWSSVPTPKAHTTIPLLGRRRPSSSIAHQVGALRLPEKRCKSLATSRSTMRAPSRIWRKRVWRQSQLRSSRSAKAFGQLLARPMCAGKLARAKSSRVVLSDRKHRTRPYAAVDHRLEQRIEHEAGTRDAAKNHPRMDVASEGQATDRRAGQALR